VSNVLHRLQFKPGKPVKTNLHHSTQLERAMKHPRPDDQGRTVTLAKPSQSSIMAAWSDPSAVACVIPDGPMPAEINGMEVAHWSEAPKSSAEWEALAALYSIEEPEFLVPEGYHQAAGVVIREPDGRVWLVAPSNAFGGYESTFPKGTLEGKSAQATALAEAFEESGLRVRLIKHLADIERSQSYTRYYLAERVGGNPADMTWETQAVMLVPMSQLGSLLNNAFDKPLLKRLLLTW
jgi:ADP-ribose pyrophosphatase YjhB (NUDIX family)